MKKNFIIIFYILISLMLLGCMEYNFKPDYTSGLDYSIEIVKGSISINKNGKELVGNELLELVATHPEVDPVIIFSAPDVLVEDMGFITVYDIEPDVLRRISKPWEEGVEYKHEFVDINSATNIEFRGKTIYGHYHYYDANENPCFVANTKIIKEQNMKPITIDKFVNLVKKGNGYILSGNKKCLNIAENVSISDVKEELIYYISVEDSKGIYEVGLTPTHCVKTNTGFVQTKDLKHGDSVITINEIGKVIDIKKEKYSGKLYNFNLMKDLGEIIPPINNWHRYTDFGIKFENHYFFANNIAISDMYVQHYISDNAKF